MIRLKYKIVKKYIMFIGVIHSPYKTKTDALHIPKIDAKPEANTSRPSTESFT